MTWKSTSFVPLYKGSIQFNPILAKLWSLILAQLSKLPYLFWLKKVTFYINLVCLTHSSTLAWKIPWTEEPGRLQVHGVSESQTRLSDFTFTFHFHALEKEMATHSSVLAWRIPGTAEPGGLPSVGSHRVGHDWSDLAAAAVVVYL